MKSTTIWRVTVSLDSGAKLEGRVLGDDLEAANRAAEAYVSHLYSLSGLFKARPTFTLVKGETAHYVDGSIGRD